MLFTRRHSCGNSPGFVIDFSDMNVWGIFAMPVGLVLCFGPALLVYWLTDYRRDTRARSTARR